MNKSLLIFMLISLFFSCSVEKRHYSTGWNINWYNKVRSVYPNTSADTLIAKTNTTPISSDTLPSNIHSPLKTSPTLTVQQKTKKQISITRILPRIISFGLQKKVEQKISTKKIARNSGPSKINNKLALASFVLALSVPLLILLGFYIGLVGFSANFTMLLIVFFLILLLALAALLLAFIFGIIAISQISKNPEIYSNQWMAIVGLVLSILIALIIFKSLLN